MVHATVPAPARACRQPDPGEDRKPAERLPGPDGVAERDDAAERPHQRLEVDERARELGRHAGLGPREQPERGQRAGQPQPRHRRDGTGCRGRRRSPLGDDRHGQRCERGGAELHGRHGTRVAARQQPRLEHDQRRGARDRPEHQQVAGGRGAGAAATGDETDAGERDERAAPRRRPGARAPEPGGDQRDEHRRRADDQRGMADAGALDPGVLEQDHASVAERAGAGDRGRQRAAQAAARQEREDRRGDREPGHREPAGAEPFEPELGQGHGQPPQRARRGKREDRAAATGQAVREGHAHIVGQNVRNSSSI